MLAGGTVTPLSVSAVTALMLVPVTTTLVPTVPVVGVKEVMAGGMVIVSVWLLAALVPAAVVTVSVPLVAPLGTVNVRLDTVLAVMLASGTATPFSVSPVALPRLVPLMVTLLPAGALVGVKLLMMVGPMINEELRKV